MSIKSCEFYDNTAGELLNFEIPKQRRLFMSWSVYAVDPTQPKDGSVNKESLQYIFFKANK